MSSSAKTILVVEDDTGIRETLKDILASVGYNVVGAGNGLEAIAILKSGTKTNLILLDLMMPVMDGLSFRAEQLKDSAIAGVPVVIMSADQRIVEKKEQAGAAGLLKKPLDLTTLLQAVKTYATD